MADRTGRDDDRTPLILVGTGMRTWREYLLGPISRHYRVHLVTTVEPSWERDFLDGWTVLPSTADGPALAAALRGTDAAAAAAGVLCWDEARIHAASYLAQALGLRNGDPAVLWRARDKAQTRAAAAAAGIRQPASVPVRTLEDALAAAEQVGYPAVLKPRGFGASLGVVRVDDPDGLRRHFPFTRDMTVPDPVVYASDHPVLVEERVTGEEVSVDAVVRAGVVTPLFVARKVVGYPPYAEEVGHYVDAADPLLTDPELTTALQDVHAAIGFADAVTHTEFMLTADGPSLIEVNGRLGGDLIPYLGRLATGIDPGLAAAATACGLPPDLTPTRREVAGIRFFYVGEPDTTIGTIEFDASALPDPVDRAVVVARPGQTLSPPPEGTVWGRIAYATAVGSSAEECARALDEAEKALHVTKAAR